MHGQQAFRHSLALLTNAQSARLNRAQARGTVARARPGFLSNAYALIPPLHRITGVADLSQIDGIGPYGALQLIAESGVACWIGETRGSGL